MVKWDMLHHAMEMHTYCRLCERSCGLIAEVEDGQIQSLNSDPSDPICGNGSGCSSLQNSIGALQRDDRITRPMRRDGDVLVPASWDEALDDIASRLKEIQKQSGADSIGMLMGESMERNSHGLIRSLATSIALGTSSVFGSLAQTAGPRIRMAELMLGSPVSLLPDLGRAHYIIVFGGQQKDSDWGPWALGGAHEQWIQHSRRTKKTKVVVVGPRKTAFAETMDQFLAIRPGTEPFLLLGMLVAVVNGGWIDRQYIDDYTRDFDALQEVLDGWTVDACATICGIEAPKLSGLALKFSRSAMSVVQPDYGTFSNAYATLGAWAWMTLHTVTANTLRPGGLYHHEGVVDVQPALDKVPTDGAPRTRVLDIPLLLMRGPAAALADEILVPGEGSIRGLICMGTDPLSTVPDSARTREALGSLDLLVCMARCEDRTTAHADWVLPITHPWERADLQLMDHRLLPHSLLRWTPALVEPNGEAKTEQDILLELMKRLEPRKGDGWGRHIRLLGRWLSKSDLDTWVRRVLDWSTDVEWDELQAPPHRVDRGDTDRSTWAVSMEDSRIHLLPDVALETLRGLVVPEQTDEYPIWLRTSLRMDMAPDGHHRAANGTDPGLAIHPDLGIADGVRVRIRTRYGSVETTAHHVEGLRPDSVDLPMGYDTDVMALLSATRLDGLCGTAALDGVMCQVEAIG